MALLNSNEIFQNLSQKEVKLIESKILFKKFRAKEQIIREWDNNLNMYIIEHWVVRIEISNDWKKQILAFLWESNLFWEISVFTWKSASANVISITPSEVKIISKEDFDKLVEQIPALKQNIINYLCNRITKSNQVVFDYAFKMLEARIAAKIIQLVAMFRGLDGNNDFINLPLTHQDIADYVGTSRETVTKILTKFKQRGAISVKTKKITITDIEKLKSFSNM